MLEPMAPVLHLSDSILYLSTLLRDHPRAIDRHIDYFGLPSEPRRATDRDLQPRAPRGV